jgi:hypothetical protein
MRWENGQSGRTSEGGRGESLTRETCSATIALQKPSVVFAIQICPVQKCKSSKPSKRTIAHNFREESPGEESNSFNTKALTGLGDK